MGVHFVRVILASNMVRRFSTAEMFVDVVEAFDFLICALVFESRLNFDDDRTKLERMQVPSEVIQPLHFNNKSRNVLTLAGVHTHGESMVSGFHDCSWSCHSSAAV